MRTRPIWALVAVLALVVAACGDGTAETTTTAGGGATTTAAPDTTAAPGTTAGEAELGSSERPIQVLFVPSVDTQVIVSGGDIMDEALTEATGLEFEVSVPTSYAATIEEMCANPSDTMGFIPGFGYVLASNLCGVDVAFKAVRFGWGVYWSQILVPRDSDIQTIEDLDGLTWAVPDLGSTSGYLVPLVQLEEAGVEPAEVVETGGHPNAALAVYRGEADFATTFFSPPLILDGEPWDIGDDPEVPEDLVDQCAPTDEEDPDLFCGENFRVLDARASTITDAPDIIQELRILAISPEIPNDTLSFGPDFPADLRAQIEQALIDFAAECEDNEDCAWNQSIGNQDFYDWTGIEPATDAEYDELRKVVDTAGIDLEDL
ncbi:MAG: phosphate/phosphite/phosphonate ABC transporter substrate-binding protein [Acidimicrobiia bacterium]